MKATDRVFCRRCGLEGDREQVTCSTCLRNPKLLDLDVLPATSTKQPQPTPDFTFYARARVIK